MKVLHAVAVVAVAATWVVACGGSDNGGETDTLDAVEALTDVTPDTAGEEVVQDVAADPAVDPATDVEDQDVAVEAEAADAIETITPPVPWGPENRGYKEVRGIVHLHSLYSHDGCAPNHEDIPAGQQAEFFGKCLSEQRTAPCASDITFMMQSDHPGDVRDQTWEDAVHYQPADGDEIVNDAKGRPMANRIKCPAGSPVDHAYFYLGTEGSKSMPVGLSKTATPENGWKSVDPQIFSVSYDDEVPLDKAQVAMAAAHDAGGFAFVAHPEQADLSVERIKALPLDGIEMFNIHPMLMQAIAAKMQDFFRVDRFMTPGADNPAADLGLLLLMAPIENDLIKFDQATPFIRLTGFGATDIHRNVELPPLCSGGLEDGGMCQNVAAEYPNFANLLVTGGPAILADGDRFDGYARSFRWMANRVLLKADAGNEAEEIRQAMGRGRSYLAFDLHGAPEGFDFFAWADGKAVEMGNEITDAASVTLYVRAPKVVAPPWGMKHVTDFSGAVVTTKVIKATAEGSIVVAEGQLTEAEFDVIEPSAWRVEVWITPKHLKPALAGVEDLADGSYPYIYSNAIFVR